MGKAGIIVIPVLIVVLVLVLVSGVVAIGKWMDDEPKESKLVRRNAELADEAMAIFRSLMIINSLDGDMDILSEKSKKTIKEWAEKYRKVNS